MIRRRCMIESHPTSGWRSGFGTSWVGWRYVMRNPKRQRCHYGGYGEGRAKGCVATASKAGKGRRFLGAAEFITRSN